VVKVTRLNGKEYFLNCDLIETIEETPDAVITLVNDKKLIVREKSAEIIERIIEYNRKIFIEKNRTS
jgi:flagellar protein FlbD